MPKKTAVLALSFIVCWLVALPASRGASLTITQVEQTPWIVDDGGTLKSETQLTIDNGQSAELPAWVKIGVAGKREYMESLGRLASGGNTCMVHVKELDHDGDNVTFSIFDNSRGDGQPLATTTVAQLKIRHWRLYVGHNSHQDIGYTDYQEVLKTKKWPSFWDQVLLSDMPKSDQWPDDSKVRLEVEGTYQLDQALPVRSADWFETLRTRLREGRFAYGAALGDIAHNSWGAEELARSTYFAERFFKDKTGVESTKNVIMRDEPTLSWGVIDALVETGAKSFAIHHNGDHNPWRGTTTYPELFYAAGKNPANKLLVWNSPVGNYCVDELDFRGGNAKNIMMRITGKLLTYQRAGHDTHFGLYAPAKVADGVIGKTDQGEWASSGEKNPWLQLTWSAPQAIDKISLYDRANPTDNAHGGILSFSDGSRIKVSGIPANGAAKTVTFPEKKVTWIRFKVTHGEGPNVGLSEVQVYSGSANIAASATATASSTYGAQKHAYPYNVAMVNFTNAGDNCPMDSRVYRNIKAINDKGYAYPRIINANYDQFFNDLAAHWSKAIPVYKGTIEDWWNFGSASTAYETGLNRMNHDKLAAAEYLATVAGVATPGRRYPSESLYAAYENMVLYDEHTWGSPWPAVDHQWRWKRNTAIASDVASTAILGDAMTAINALIPTAGQTVVVYNNLTWRRSDVVTIAATSLPPHFELADVASGAAVPYQKLDDGAVTFVAANVPGLGYKTFRVTPRDADPVFPAGSVTARGNTLENRYFKVTFDRGGNVTSILDKQNGNAEMVDAAAPHPLNQYLLYKEGALAATTTAATTTAQSGPVLGCVTADGVTTGLDGLRRKVILYDSLPRIDIVNDTLKGQQIANVEMGYFSFPLRVDNFLLRHEMPTGDMKPGVNPDIDDPANEQYFTSSTAFATVNRWIDVSNQRDWGVTFASLGAPLVSYGRPDRGATKGGWDVNYNAQRPWIYSMAFNNEWQTNFQKTQPGRVIFRYSLRGHAGGNWQAGGAETFGAETASPLRASLVAAAQPGRGLAADKGQFLAVNQSNVVLTAAKMAEANGEGLIVRFNEIKGQATPVKVDLGWFTPAAVVETDIVENDKRPVALDGSTIAFTIPPFGFKTFRIVRGTAPEPVAGVTAAFDDRGCLVSWKDQPAAACFEVFRGTKANFTPPTGSYVATVSGDHYYDPTVKAGLKRNYYYVVRAVQFGKKSAFSAAAGAVPGLAADTIAPSAPLASGEALHSSKVTLSWQPSVDNYAAQGYKVYRDGTQIADVAACLNCWLDTAVKPATAYTYTVKAYDVAGNLSAASKPLEIRTLP
jgi:hypothetical protein